MRSNLLKWLLALLLPAAFGLSGCAEFFDSFWDDSGTYEGLPPPDIDLIEYPGPFADVVTEDATLDETTQPSPDASSGVTDSSTESTAQAD